MTVPAQWIRQRTVRSERHFAEEIPDTTKLIIAQRISSVQDADHIIVMDEGTVNGFGTHEELMETKYRFTGKIYESQTKGGGDFDEKGRRVIDGRL